MIAFRRIRVWIACGAFALAGVAVQAQENNLPRVLGPALAAPVVVTTGPGVTVRARTALPDLALIEALARRPLDTPERPRFVIDLFPGLELEAEVISSEVRAHGSTVFARLTKSELGSAMFTYEAGVLNATVDSPGGNYVIVRQPDGVYQVAQLALHKLPAEMPPLQGGSVIELPDLPESDVPVDSGRLIDVMVVWTPAAQTANGGAAAMQSLAQASVDNSNLTYLNSGIAQRLRLVHAQQVTYAERTTCTEGNVFYCGLYDMTGNGDGFMDNVHTLRDTHGADLVSLLVADGSYCGLAWLFTGSASSGFSVVNAQSCAVNNKTFAHELGHNMGAHHDPYVAPGPGAYAYSHGIINLASRWRDVMAYVDECLDTPPFTNCPKIQYMSTPKLTYNGAALGDAAVCNNTHTLNKTAKAIAAFRPTAGSYPVPQRFADVAPSHPFYGHIEFFAQAGVTSGCSAGLYCPNSPVTREQLAAFLERAMKASNWTPPAAIGLFTDVPPGAPFRNFIEALKNDGITSGCGPTTYCPEAPVTRAQMAAFVLRARCGSSYLPNMPGSQTFSDVALSHPLVRYIQKLYTLGITGGCASGPLRYCPDKAVTRGEMAVFIERAYPFLTPSEVCTP
jgi:peptidyl-Asp metalloendopeptidase